MLRLNLLPSILMLLFMAMVPALWENTQALAKDDSLYSESLSFTDDDGSSVQLSQWRGHKVVLAFAYTSCRVTCPLTIRHLKSIVKSSLTTDPNAPEIVIVTIDPVKDTVSRLSKFRQTWELSNKNWHFLRGSLGDTRQLADKVGFRFFDDMGHIFHDDKIFILDQAGKVSQTIKGWDSATAENVQ